MIDPDRLTSRKLVYYELKIYRISLYLTKQNTEQTNSEAMFPGKYSVTGKSKEIHQNNKCVDLSVSHVVHIVLPDGGKLCTASTAIEVQKTRT